MKTNKAGQERESKCYFTCMIMEDLFGKVTSEQRFEGNEGQSHVDDQGTQASKYEDPEMGKCSRSSKYPSVAEANKGVERSG